MDEIGEAVKTVTKMSPPMLVIVGTAILNIIIKPFVPEKYLMPIATVSGASVAPWLFSHGTLAYDVPSPGTALVLIGAIMGFVGSVFHRRLDRWLRSKFLNGNGHDTKFFTRTSVSPSDPPENQGTASKSG